eukprot:7049828-Ditylum_brightwellii.AAC.1
MIRNLLRTNPGETQEQKLYKAEGWLLIFNLLDWSNSYTISSLPRNEMVLSSYMLSPAYSGYLKKRG